ACFNFLDDCNRIFASWIVGSHNSVITFASGRCSHERTLGPIAIPTAAEHHDQPPDSDFAGSLQNLIQSIISVCVVDDDGEPLACAARLESARHTPNLSNTVENSFGLKPQADSHADCGSHIVEVRLAH